MEKSSFFNSMNGDRRYKAEEFAQYFSSFIGNGVFPDPTTGLQVIAGTNMAVKIKAGKAWINGYMYQNTDMLNKTIDNADGVLNRIDRVVVRLNVGQRNIEIKVKKGTPGSNPVPPVLQRDEEIWELAIADVQVRKGVIRITNADIIDKRHDSTVCGIVASAVQQLDATGLFAQYDALFNNFLQNLQNSLSGDVAGNLLNKLNDKQNKMVMSDRDFIAVLTSNKTETDNAYLFMSRGDNGGSISGLGMTLYQALKNCETYTGYTIKYKSKPNAQEAAMNQNDFRNPAFYLAVVDKANKKKLTITPVGGNSEEIEEIREQVQQCFWSASEMKTKIANALTGKGIPTSTTASTEKIVKNINSAKIAKEIVISRPIPKLLNDTSQIPPTVSEENDHVHGKMWKISTYRGTSKFARINDEPLNLKGMKNIIHFGGSTIGPDKYFYLTKDNRITDDNYLRSNGIDQIKRNSIKISSDRRVDISNYSGLCYLYIYSDSYDSSTYIASKIIAF